MTDQRKIIDYSCACNCTCCKVQWVSSTHRPVTLISLLGRAEGSSVRPTFFGKAREADCKRTTNALAEIELLNKSSQ